MSDTRRDSTEFSITIRPGETDGVKKYEDKVLEFLDRECSHYVCAYEQKGDVSTQHFQIAGVFLLSKRSDNLKVSLINILGTNWTEAQKQHAVCVRKNRQGNDIRLVAGGYCMKQDDHPFIKGWTMEQLEPYAQQYEELKRKADMKNVTRENVTKILKDMYDGYLYHKNPDVRDTFERFDDKTKLQWMFKRAISEGYDLQKYSTPLWVNYYVAHFDVVFEGRTVDQLDELICQPRI